MKVLGFCRAIATVSSCFTQQLLHFQSARPPKSLLVHHISTQASIHSTLQLKHYTTTPVAALKLDSLRICF